MIREIINFVKHLEAEYTEAFNLNKKPTPGLHLWVELDEEGKWKNKRLEKGVDYVLYDGKQEMQGLHFEALKFESFGLRAGTTMNKVLDKKKQIFSCSPFILSFKIKSLSNEKLAGTGTQKIVGLLKYYFENSICVCLDETQEYLKQKSISFQNVLPEVLGSIENMPLQVNENQENITEYLKDDFYINIYLLNVDEEDYKLAHEKYLKEKLFNTDKYNYFDKKSQTLYGFSNYLNGANSKKPFLEHKSASMHKGISGRIEAEDALALNQFEILLNNKVLPNPLPLFIDPKEFKTGDEIIRLFNGASDNRLTFPQLIKAFYEKNDQRILANYYLLNISRGVVNDFDFVSTFEYQLHDCKIINLFKLKSNKELFADYSVKTIFGFENIIVRKIFNNALVKETKNGLSYNYFNDIDPNYVSGGDEMANLILRFRKAFYDYIYKSRKQAISQNIFDEIMWISILSDVRHDEFKENYHTKETSIKEKLNIWLSLSQYFTNYKSINMANKFKELLEKTDAVANDSTAQLTDDVSEFMFCAGQVIYFLLSRSKASAPSHALLEPFLQKTSAPQLQDAISNCINAYKHDINFGKGRFERLSAQVLAFDTSENIKNYQRYLLSGYFAPAVIYTKKEELETESINN